MNVINSLLRPLFDGLLFPFRGMSPWAGLVVVSLITAIGMLLVFRATSNQERIKAIKRQIHACLFEMRLFNDDLRAIVRAQLEILWHNLFYVLHSSVPVVWMIVPLVLTIAHLQAYYGYEPPAPGRTVLLTATLADGVDERPEARLELPGGVTSPDAEATWLPSLGELVWRLSIDEPGSHVVTLNIAGDAIDKTIDADRAVVPRSPLRSSESWWDALLYPRERPVEGEAVAKVSLTLEPAAVSFFGVGMPWLVPFFVLSMVFAWVLRKPFGVTL